MQSVKTSTLDVNTRTPLSWDFMIRQLAPLPSWDEMVADLRSKPAQLREESALYSATLLAQTRDSMTDEAITQARALGLRGEQLERLCHLASKNRGTHRLTPTIRAQVHDGRVVRVWRIQQRRRAPKPGSGRVIFQFDPNAADEANADLKVTNAKVESNVHPPAAPDCVSCSDTTGAATATTRGGNV